jgi:hypothetical protein
MSFGVIEIFIIAYKKKIFFKRERIIWFKSKFFEIRAKKFRKQKTFKSKKLFTSKKTFRYSKKGPKSRFGFFILF